MYLINFVCCGVPEPGEFDLASPRRLTLRLFQLIRDNHSRESFVSIVLDLCLRIRITLVVLFLHWLYMQKDRIDRLSAKVAQCKSSSAQGERAN